MLWRLKDKKYIKVETILGSNVNLPWKTGLEGSQPSLRVAKEDWSLRGLEGQWKTLVFVWAPQKQPLRQKFSSGRGYQEVPVGEMWHIERKAADKGWVIKQITTMGTGALSSCQETRSKFRTCTSPKGQRNRRLYSPILIHLWGVLGGGAH